MDRFRSGKARDVFVSGSAKLTLLLWTDRALSGPPPAAAGAAGGIVLS